MRMGVEITDEMFQRAAEEAQKREPYINHHFDVDHLTEDQRNIIGFLGEFACCELLGIDWKGNIGENYYNIDSGDITFGKKIFDVKTETIPQPYFDRVFNRRIDDDKPYGRRLITEEQIPLLSKYDYVIFGAFVREKYRKWYALGYIESEYLQRHYAVTDTAPFGKKYPVPAMPVKMSEVKQMNRLVEYARKINEMRSK